MKIDWEFDWIWPVMVVILFVGSWAFYQMESAAIEFADISEKNYQELLAKDCPKYNRNGDKFWDNACHDWGRIEHYYLWYSNPKPIATNRPGGE